VPWAAEQDAAGPEKEEGCAEVSPGIAVRPNDNMRSRGEQGS